MLLLVIASSTNPSVFPVHKPSHVLFCEDYIFFVKESKEVFYFGFNIRKYKGKNTLITLLTNFLAEKKRLILPKVSNFLYTFIHITQARQSLARGLRGRHLPSRARAMPCW